MGDETRGNALLVVAICLAIVATVLVTVRLWARFFKLRKVGLDDYTIIPAYIVSISATAVTLTSCYRYGYNGHVWELSIHELYMGSIFNYCETILYPLARAFVNISFLLLYLRVFSRTNRTLLRRLLIGSIIIIALYSTACILAWIFQCWPVEAYWRQMDISNPYRESFTCITTAPMEKFIAIMIVLTQIWIALLPLYVVQREKVTKSQKQVLLMLVGLGALVVGASSAALYHQMRVLTGNHIDSTWEEYPMFIWNLIALYTAIICACVPASSSIIASWLAPKSILARFRAMTEKDRLQGVPKDVEPAERCKAEEGRPTTATVTMTKGGILTCDSTSMSTDEMTDTEFRLQTPDRVAMKELHAV